ncbi:MAG TPA: M1 family metallopeptidase [Longimicrobiales bacterium]|nr:M1 family metallopeptidase [Longimicrobiales bacterium]
MIHRSFFPGLLAAGLLLALPGAPLSAQSGQAPERAVRRDLPLTNSIRKALEAGTRDSTGRPGSNYWQMRADYSIRTRLDPATSTVTGSERIVIHNTSPDSLPFIVLRLDQNIFNANVARAERVPEITGGMTITRMTLDGAEVAAGAAAGGRGAGRRAEPPTVPTATGLDQTVARIMLPTPVAPGARATLDIDWSFRVPRVEGGRGLRMGAWPDSLFQVAQWYPRVAKYDDLRGWDTEPYLGPSEFYNNFGSFDVWIDVPAGWIVGATGVLQNPDEVLTPEARARLARVLESDETITIVGADERGPGNATAAGTRLVWHFAADTVNDFAWAASDHYIWDATRATIEGLGPIPIHMLYTPGRAQSWERAPGILRHALEFYSELWMPYAFPQLTMADGPETGMEYPMFIMSGVGAADHEVGHEWWPMMVGTNETWYGFMDEGFNQYMNLLSNAHRAGRVPSLDGMGQRYGSISGNENEAPLMWNANYGGSMYSFQAYSKAPLMLSMLGGIVGDSAVWTAMSDYAHTWRFRHPSPWDYAFFMNDALDRDLSWFWNSWLFTTDAVDGSIADVRTTASGTTVVVRQDGQMPSPVVLRVDFAPDGPAIRMMPNSTRLGETSAIVTWPADVWFPGSRTFTANLDFGGRLIESVTLDPFGRFPDRDVTDNVWPRAAAASTDAAGVR